MTAVPLERALGHVGVRTWLGVLFLATQLGMVVHGRFDPARYYCWAPHDAQNEYRVAVTVGGRALRQDEVIARYRLTWKGVNPRAIEQLLDVVRQYERTHGAKEGAEVRVLYRTNGGPVREWYWPER